METKYFNEFEPITISVVNQVVYNDIIEGFIYWVMDIKDVNYKRFVASEGMALKWKMRMFHYGENKVVEDYVWSRYDAVIDLNSLIGKVEEIPVEQYEKETSHCCLGLANLR